MSDTGEFHGHRRRVVNSSRAQVRSFDRTNDSSSSNDEGNSKTDEGVPDISKITKRESFSQESLSVEPREADSDQSPVRSISPNFTPTLLKSPNKPVIVLRARDADGLETQVPISVPSPMNYNNIPTLLSGVNPAPNYQIRRSSNHKPGASIETVMSQHKVLKIVDEFFNWVEPGPEILMDHTDYLVISIIGTQGAGKSTLLSHLGGSLSNRSNAPIFATQTSEQIEVGSHCTSGIDMYVTSERLILLDSQPLLSASILDGIVNSDRKYPSEFSCAENCVEMQSLQMITFLLTVSHVVIVEQDWFLNVNLMRLLQTAEMLKPSASSRGSSMSASESELSDYHPHVVFVLNHANCEDFTASSYLTMQQTLIKVFDMSNLKLTGTVSMKTNDLIPGIPSNSKDFNLFLLPDFNKENDDIYKGHPSYRFLLDSLYKQLTCCKRVPIGNMNNLGEKHWFVFASRMWESIKKSSLLSEYSRLLLV